MVLAVYTEPDTQFSSFLFSDVPDFSDFSSRQNQKSTINKLIK